MKIVVCVKQVPDTASEKALRSEDSTLDRDAVDAVMNEMDEFAVEEALQLAERTDGEVTVLLMGPDQGTETIRKALSMGAHKGIHVVDDALHGSDAVATSAVLAAALASEEGAGGAYDLIILGSEASDARTSLVPAMLAERLGLPQLTFAQKVDTDGANVTVERLTDYGHDVVTSGLPAVVSVVEKINEPRYPSFKGIMAAKKKPVSTLDLGDLGLDAAEVGAAGAWSKVEDFAVRPPRTTGELVKDEGDGGKQLVSFLASRKLV
ncbi:electron transfer flavoprotein subunit beta [Wenjunlia tyrosinilytica]|uniref:Electron transfer flavoprotein subunit beta n=1 Tax=Wenjunlia tyrosinilytica TaxID=1544741 RepID=A0A917ZU20_9ACTN|nr:electron transfer flavoprotein subunit beta/FixA family protein [Wenjunlia tyrosinilytica]GGO92962.1 electron transfer flavoprotein subunit beta [Wenjunlia tyrosinilytica]